MVTDLNDPQYWRLRAEEAQSVADNLVDDREIKDLMRRIAADYERIAKFTEMRKKVPINE